MTMLIPPNYIAPTGDILRIETFQQYITALSWRAAMRKYNKKTDYLASNDEGRFPIHGKPNAAITSWIIGNKEAERVGGIFEE